MRQHSITMHDDDRQCSREHAARCEALMDVRTSRAQCGEIPMRFWLIPLLFGLFGVILFVCAISVEEFPDSLSSLTLPGLMVAFAFTHGSEGAAMARSGCRGRRAVRALRRDRDGRRSGLASDLPVTSSCGEHRG